MKTILFALAVTFGALAATAADFALAFDGTNDYVRVASAPELTLSNRFTLEFWFKPTNTSQSNAYLLSHNGLNPAGQSAVIYKFSGNAVEFYATGFSGADPRPGSAMIISDTQWHHVAYSYDGTNWNGYLDGLAVFALNRSFSLNTSPNHWFIGCASPGLNLVAGTFDEVRIWNSARSGNEIQQNMNRRLPQSKPGLVGYYKLDDGAGTITADSS
ncbi:MAG TPA: LamG domain-containing protein, partial [Candidatus Paceibacterota bacterium]|nr:LamG domain-containing protein [Candidatus Paceibacterota bacterium]